MAKSRRVDHLGLRSAMADRLLPILVGAMSFLAALAIAGTLAAAALAVHWQTDTGAALTVQVPDPDGLAANGKDSRVRRVLAALLNDPDVRDAKALTAPELDDLLRPWFGAASAALALPIPAVITANWQAATPPDALAAALAAIAPGTITATGARWAGRVAALTESVQACAAAILIIVAGLAVAVVALATRAGLAQRRDAIKIIHGLGALDTDIADSFAGRALILTVIGASFGTLCALPVLFWLAGLVAPFSGALPASGIAARLPEGIWVCLPILPLIAAMVGWGTAQATVRQWLRGLQ